MGLFEREKSSDDYTIIVGCGRLGANLANALSDIGRKVTIIDISTDSFRKLSPSFGGIVTTGNATDLHVLEDAEIEKATSVVSVTNNDNTNIMIAQLAKELYGVRQVVARLYEKERECVYQELGISTISPAVLSEKEVDRLLGVSTQEYRA